MRGVTYPLCAKCKTRKNGATIRLSAPGKWFGKNVCGPCQREIDAEVSNAVTS